jgi:hypothetical protein
MARGANSPDHEHAAVVAHDHDPTDEPKPHANSHADPEDHGHGASDPGEREKGSGAKADQADSHAPGPPADHTDKDSRGAKADQADSHGSARSDGGDDEGRQDAKAEKASARVSVRSDGGDDEDRQDTKAEKASARVSVRSNGGDDEHGQDAKAEKASARVSDLVEEVSPSAAQFEVASYSVAVPVDVALAERLVRADRLPAETVAERPTDSPSPVVDVQEEPSPVARVDRHDVVVAQFAVQVVDHSERFLSPPSTERDGGTAGATLAKFSGPPANPAGPAGDGTTPGSLRPPYDAPGDARMAPPPGATDAVAWPRPRGVAPERDPAPAAGISGRTEARAAVVPLTGPAPGDGAPAEAEPPQPAEAAGLIARFLPFDTAALREAVGEFLRAMEPAIPAITEGLTPLGWAGLLAAALAAGAGVVLRPDKRLARWRRRASGGRTARSRWGRSDAGGSVP